MEGESGQLVWVFASTGLYSLTSAWRKMGKADLNVWRVWKSALLCHGPVAFFLLAEGVGVGTGESEVNAEGEAEAEVEAGAEGEEGEEGGEKEEEEEEEEEAEDGVDERLL